MAAPPVAFRILANTFLGAGLALDGPANDRRFRIVWLGGGGGGRRIGEALVVEHRPELGEVERSSLRQVRELPGNATDAFAPWSN